MGVGLLALQLECACAGSQKQSDLAVQRTTAPAAPAAPAAPTAPAAPQPEQAETLLPHATTLLVVESLTQAVAGLKRRVDMLEGEWQHRLPGPNTMLH